jgi:two-component system sensor histidine kinase/response regulator
MSAATLAAPEFTIPPFKPAGAKVLVVDDDRVNLRILRGILEKAGYAIAEAGSGEDALTQCETFKPDLVLLDVILPGMDGFATCRELFTRHGKAAPPVIFITAKNAADDIVEGLTAGGVDYVPKPFRQNEVLARIRTHLQMRRLMAEQRALVTQLSRANEAKNRFLGMAAHDLRNPLASIRGLAEFLRDGTLGPVTADQVDTIDTIQQASQSMLNLVNELLDVATIEAGQLKLTLAPAALAELVEKSVVLNGMEAAKKKTKIVFAAATTASPVLPLDAAKIRQVVDNLLSNAVKYSPPGSTVTVALHHSGSKCGFVVQDQGPGIPDSERDKLFQDFGRLSAQPTGGEKSTGLGLAICRKIVEAHGGTIAAENLPPRGCEFRVTLPLPASVP